METVEYYFMSCGLYREVRHEQQSKVPDGAWRESDDYDLKTNRQKQEIGQEFIIKTKRFEK